MTFDAHKNFAYSTVATAPSPATSGTSLVVAAVQGALFPAVPFNCAVWPTGVQPSAANAEIVRVTGISTDTFTITRAQEGSSARSIIVGDQIAETITAKALSDIEAAIPAFATPAVVLGLVPAAGAATTVIRSDATMAGLLAGLTFNQSWMQQVANVGAATRTVSGMVAGPANTGTITSGDDTDGPWQTLTTAASTNTEATMYTATMFRRDWGAVAFGSLKTPGAFSAVRFNAGFSSAALGTAAMPATQCAVFRYDTTADATAFWRCCTNNAGTGTVDTTTVAITVGTVYRWAIRLLGSSVEYYLATGDGALALVASQGSTLPTATTLLALVTRVLTLDGSSKAMQWGRHSIVMKT